MSLVGHECFRKPAAACSLYRHLTNDNSYIQLSPPCLFSIYTLSKACATMTGIFAALKKGFSENNIIEKWTEGIAVNIMK